MPLYRGPSVSSIKHPLYHSTIKGLEKHDDVHVVCYYVHSVHYLYRDTVSLITELRTSLILYK